MKKAPSYLLIGYRYIVPYLAALSIFRPVDLNLLRRVCSNAWLTWTTPVLHHPHPPNVDKLTTHSSVNQRQCPHLVSNKSHKISLELPTSIFICEHNILSTTKCTFHAYLERQNHPITRISLPVILQCKHSSICSEWFSLYQAHYSNIGTSFSLMALIS